MNKSKIILGLTFLTFISLLLISSKNIQIKNNKIGNIAIIDFHSFSEKKLNTLFFTVNVKDFLSTTIEDANLFSLALNIDTNEDTITDEVIMIIPVKGEMCFYGPFSSKHAQESYVYDSKTLVGKVLITPVYSEPITYVVDGLKLYAGIKTVEDTSLFDFMDYPLFNTTVFKPSTFTSTTIIIELPKNILTNSKTQSFNSSLTIKRL